MRKRNWRIYNRALVHRGSITFLIDQKLLDNLEAKTAKKMGRPVQFSDALISLLMMIKIHYRLTYRALEGFAKAILLNFSLPTYSLICKRALHLIHSLPALSTRRPATMILDASGLKVCGEGEWKVKVHGRAKPPKWIKIHIGIDPKTQEIVAETTTTSKTADSKQTHALLKQTPNSVKITLSDGAYDRKEAREAICKKGSQALIPPPKNGRLRGDGGQRDDALRIITSFGGGKLGKSIWGKLTGYSIRVLVETAFSRMKRLFGERLFSKIFEKQRVENRLRCLLLNKMRRQVA